MAKFKVIGPFEVNGTAPGGVTEIGDDSGLNVGALLSAGLVELVDEKPVRPEKKDA